jgi:rhodanese-related sulfurtransferase/DNA-binding MarR family transcriptional regulator
MTSVQDPADHRAFKYQLYEQFSRIGKAISNPHRIELLDLLAQGERSVEELAREAAVPIANASQHLQALRRAQLVEVRRDGLYQIYRLADERVFQLIQVLRELADARFAEIDRLIEAYLRDRQELEAIDAPTLLRRMADEDLVVLDVRPASEFRSGHIAGALSIPVDELERRVGELPRDRDVIAYCRGPYCVYSDEAVALLRERGFRATRLDTGLPDWRAAGFPVEPAGMGGRRG